MCYVVHSLFTLQIFYCNELRPIARSVVQVHAG